MRAKIKQIEITWKYENNIVDKMNEGNKFDIYPGE